MQDSACALVRYCFDRKQYRRHAFSYAREIQLMLGKGWLRLPVFNTQNPTVGHTLFASSDAQRPPKVLKIRVKFEPSLEIITGKAKKTSDKGSL